METIEKPRVVISQADNFAAQFGHVLRSSAIFWARHDDILKTTISFVNYWQFKSGIDVAVVVNLRERDGTLISREPVSFAASEVCNYVPPRGFAGSVEVEIFAIANLRIPYAAIMAVYEAADSVSMVHAYARAYSQHEVEDGRTICVGEEGCWSIRDDAATASFAVFHNGPIDHPPQRATLRVRNHAGAERRAEIALGTLRPFETITVVPGEHIADLCSFLDGQPGNARLSFSLGQAFTRMLCGNRARDWRQLQVTHSNFDYSAHATDMVAGAEQAAYVQAPPLPPGRRPELVIYPDASPGEYTVEYGGHAAAFATGDLLRIDAADAAPIVFHRHDGALPSRIVVGWTVKGPARTVPAECSVGIVHHRQPPKHTAWMVVSQEFGSLITWVDYAEVYGGCPDDAVWDCALYSAVRKEPWRARLLHRDIAARPYLTVADLSGADIDLGGQFGYLLVRCSYGGFLIYSTLHKKQSLAIEHSF